MDALDLWTLIVTVIGLIVVIYAYGISHPPQDLCYIGVTDSFVTYIISLQVKDIILARAKLL